MGGLAFIATNRTAPGEVTCFHAGSLTVGEFAGPPSARTHALALQFNEAGVKTRVAENLDSARWHKLVWNVPSTASQSQPEASRPISSAPIPPSPPKRAPSWLKSNAAPRHSATRYRRLPQKAI